jgi:hypothetical protein
VRTPFALVVLVACATTIAVGCGNSERDGGSSAPATSAQTTEATTRGPLSDVEQRLRAGGFQPTPNDVSGAALASIDVGSVTVYAYADEAAAAEDLAAIREAFAEQPGRGLAERVGTRVYYVAAERTLTAADRAKLARVVAIGEGRQP